MIIICLRCCGGIFIYDEKYYSNFAKCLYNFDTASFTKEDHAISFFFFYLPIFFWLVEQSKGVNLESVNCYFVDTPTLFYL